MDNLESQNLQKSDLIRIIKDQPEVKALVEILDTVYNDINKVCKSSWSESIKKSYLVSINEKIVSSLKSWKEFTGQQSANSKEKFFDDGNYSVTDDGRVYSHYEYINKFTKVKRSIPLLLKQYPDKKGYLRVYLGRKVMQVHRIVAEQFIGACPEGKECGHKDDVKNNNSVSNLHWITRKENIQEAIMNGAIKVGERHHAAKLTEAQVVEIIKRRTAGERPCDLGREFNISPKLIPHIMTGKVWKHVHKALRGADEK